MNLPDARLEIQKLLDSKKTMEERNMLGQFATPPALAQEITRCALQYLPESAPLSFMEPALGTGAFYEALINEAQQRVSNAVGVEIDPLFASEAKAFWEHKGLTVINEDYTELESGSIPFRCNLLITNPPYVRHHHIPPERKKQLVGLSAKSSGITLSGLSGLYVHFMMIAHSWLEPGAVSAWLIPSEFMDVNYGSGLRKYLTERVELLRVHRFSPEDVQFDDALVTSTVVIFRNARPSPQNLVRFSSGGSLLEPTIIKEFDVHELNSTNKWGSIGSRSKIADAKGSVILGDAFTIKRGLATGDNGFFIRSYTEYEQLGVPRKFLRPILPAPRYLKDLVVEGDQEGRPIVETPLALFHCDLPEDLLAKEYPDVWSFLQEGVKDGVSKRYLCSGRKPWYSQERREVAPVLCTYMGRPKPGQSPFRIIRNKSEAVATNVYLMLYPKRWLTELENSDDLITRICEDLRQLDASAFTSEGRVYGGGLHKMEPRELSKVRLGIDLPVRAEESVAQGTLFERRRAYAG